MKQRSFLYIALVQVLLLISGVCCASCNFSAADSNRFTNGVDLNSGVGGSNHLNSPLAELSISCDAPNGFSLSASSTNASRMIVSGTSIGLPYAFYFSDQSGVGAEQNVAASNYRSLTATSDNLTPRYSKSYSLATVSTNVLMFIDIPAQKNAAAAAYGDSVNVVLSPR